MIAHLNKPTGELTTPPASENNMTNTSNTLVLQDLISELPIKPDGFTSKLIFQDESSKTVLFAFDSDQSLKEHTAPFPIAIHFLSGAATCSIAGIPYQASTNSYFRIPAQVLHSIHAHAPTHMLLTLFKQPE